MTDNQTAVLIITIPALIAAIHHHQMMLKHGRLQRTSGSRTAPTRSQYHKQEAALHRIALFTAVLIPILLATAILSL
jgi:hypothetical protein